MTHTILITSEHSYEVNVGAAWLESLKESTTGVSRVLIVSSVKFPIREIDLGESEVFYCEIPDGEDGKSIQTLDELWKILGAAGFTRSDCVVAIGGGAVTDVAGYAAASWLRGIPWISIPTTVAGMVDAAIGGKTAINSPYGKNLIGAFHSPRRVIVDITWLDTLSDRDFSAGLAEVIKCGFIKDSTILADLQSVELQELQENSLLLESIIAKAISVKGSVVSSDFKEGFEREILNYGHTFGHAIEKYSHFSLRHGECVAIGMIYVAHLAHNRGLISDQELHHHYEILRKFNLPTTANLKASDWDALYAIMALDKKARGNVLRFVVLNGRAEVTRLEDVDMPELYKAYEKVLP